MTTVQSKGKDLEDAIEKIESTILKADPSLKEGTFRIESRKVINVVGVHHEIDVFVSINHGNAYGSVFIFESKNWEEKVGKNEIITFSEKIKVASAQRGFFVAKGYTKDAENQAVLDPRMSLLTVSDNFSINIPDIHVVLREKPGNVELHFIKHKNKPKSLADGVKIAIDQDADTIIVSGIEKPLKELVNDIYENAVQEKLKHAPTQSYPEGEYILEHAMILDYDPPLHFKNNDFEQARVKAQIPIKILRPQIVSRFDIATRGRVVTFEAVEFGEDNSFTLSLIGH